MQNNYESYSVADFLEDDFFIQWIKYKRADDEQFWSEWIAAEPANLKAMREAADQLRIIFSLERIVPQVKDEEEVWSKITATISTEQAKVVPMNRGRLLFKIAAAAIIIVMLGVGGYLIFNKSEDKQTAEKGNDQKLKKDVLPGGNRAVLTLSDGSIIILDSSSNGTLAQQGNTKIIKLDDGQLAYNSGSTNQGEVLYNTISTPRGGQYQLTLPDGSKVWLNAASSLRFPAAFTGKERNVELTGEGYFEVAKNAKMPFRVKVNEMMVEVLGTHFNINAYNDEKIIRTTLLEGSVKINASNTTVTLKPDQQAFLADNASSFMVTQVNTADVVAWKNGFFSVHDADIKTVMRQLARWYDVEVTYQGENNSYSFTGKIDRNLTLQQVLNGLSNSRVHFRIEEGNHIVITP